MLHAAFRLSKFALSLYVYEFISFYSEFCRLEKIWLKIRFKCDFVILIYFLSANECVGSITIEMKF